MSTPRVVPFEGARNFRDLGGYRNRHGRPVRRERVYRSGSLHRLTAADQARLASLGLLALFDLRGADERLQHDCRPVLPTALRYWTNDAPLELGDLRRLIGSPATSGESAREAMHALYASLPYALAPAFATVLRALAAHELPLAFHCTAGKDRTGVLAALILELLEVPREQILEDYALTGELDDLRWALEPRLRESTAIEILLRADPDYLDTALATLSRRSGSVEAWAIETAGLSAGEIGALRDALL